MKREKTERRKVAVKDCDKYFVDDHGDIYGYYGKKIKQESTHDGYRRVTLHVDGKLRHRPVHRLVAEAFIPNPENKPTVNHIDGDKTNNSVSNLEWSTHSENSQHAYDLGLNRCHFTDEDRSKSRRTIIERYSKRVRIVETGDIYPSAKECARVNDLDPGNICACCNRTRKTHRDLHFEWVSEDKR